MVFSGGGIDPNSARDLAHARQIEARGRAAELRRDPNQARHRELANGMGGRILWGKIFANVLGVAGALAFVAILFTVFRG
jgi:hypothetical protein